MLPLAIFTAFSGCGKLIGRNLQRNPAPGIQILPPIFQLGLSSDLMLTHGFTLKRSSAAIQDNASEVLVCHTSTSLASAVQNWARCSYSRLYRDSTTIDRLILSVRGSRVRPPSFAI
jgi:hypothetical protein